MSKDYENNPAVVNLRNYLKIRSEHPNIDYGECIEYLKGQANELGFTVKVFEPVPKNPILVMTWEGLEPSLPSILLNSHMDVVPVFENSWKYPPFEARIVDGVIYARGAQDMKSVGVMYLEALKRLKANGSRFKRTVHLSFMPDEEVGGGKGMGEFVKTEDYKKLNVGFALDEGIASPTEDYIVYNAERSIWHITIICPGKSGHGSLLLPDNNGEKIRYMIDKFMDLRAEAKEKLNNDSTLTVGDVTTVNLTMLQGGIQNNVVPEKLTVSFDIRLATSVNHEDFENTIKRWCQEAGEGVTYEFEQKAPNVPPTKLDESNVYWLAFKAAFESLKLPIKIRTFPGGTDSRKVREAGVPALGISPIVHTVPQLHAHNESLKVDTFLQGITVYESVIPAVCNA